MSINNIIKKVRFPICSYNILYNISNVPLECYYTISMDNNFVCFKFWYMSPTINSSYDSKTMKRNIKKFKNEINIKFDELHENDKKIILKRLIISGSVKNNYDIEFTDEFKNTDFYIKTVLKGENNNEN